MPLYAKLSRVELLIFISIVATHALLIHCPHQADAFMVPNDVNRHQTFYHQIKHLHQHHGGLGGFAHLTNKCEVSTSTTSLFSSQLEETSAMAREDLQKLTVKQLKEKIKELQLPVKTSHLKLKKDIVDFLFEQLSSKNGNENDVEEKTDEAPIPIPPQSNGDEKGSTPKKQKPKNAAEPLKAKTAKNNDEVGSVSEQRPPAKLVSPKDIIFEKVLNRYPPLRDLQKAVVARDEGESIDLENVLMHNPNFYKSYTGLGEMDIRQEYHPMLSSLTSSDLDIVTVGTASCVPGVTRGVSCTALRLQWKRSDRIKNDSNMVTGGIYIFDCGESTQLQIQRTGSIRPGKISKIFITHAHGDHSFGLPGLLCIMGQDRDRDGPPLDIYGPEGLRMWLRTCVRYSISRIVPPYRVHEIMDIPMAPEWSQGRYKNGRYFYELDSRRRFGKQQRQQSQPRHWGTQGLAGEDPVSWISRAPMLNLQPSSQFGEVEGGRDIYPIYNHPKCIDGAPIWEVEDEGDVKIYAAPMSHGVPCVGYVVEEEGKPGRLKNDIVAPIAKRNIKGLKAAGMRVPMKVMATIKDLPLGGSYTFPDGTVVHQKDVVDPPRKGRKIVVCGDTADSRAIAGVGQGADILIHEATNAFLSGIDKDTSKAEVTKDARIHGHSTPSCAGSFAKRIGAKRLILNHFSSRYKGDQSLESLSIMTRIEQDAIKASGLDEDKVAAAWDFMICPVPQE